MNGNIACIKLHKLLKEHIEHNDTSVIYFHALYPVYLEVILFHDDSSSISKIYWFTYFLFQGLDPEVCCGTINIKHYAFMIHNSVNILPYHSNNFHLVNDPRNIESVPNNFVSVPRHFLSKSFYIISHSSMRVMHHLLCHVYVLYMEIKFTKP